MKSVLLCVAALVAVGACNKGNGSKVDPGAAPSSSTLPSGAITTSKAQAEAARLNPAVSEDDIQRVTNPTKRPPYTGPTGSVTGTVRMSGDASPALFLAGIPLPTGDRCAAAREMYKSAYREGSTRGLADVLVAVTRYDAYLPPRKAPQKVALQGCAFNTRTVALMYGETVQVQVPSGEAGSPDLLGSPTPALLIAVPGGDPVELHPRGVGLDRLVDRSHEYTFADVYVLPYPTVAVTDLDGHFEISGIPVGNVKLNAMLPATGDTVERDVVITQDGKIDVGEVLFSFDADKYTAAAAEQQAKLKPVDPKELEDRRARAKVLAENLVNAARGAATQNPNPGAAPTVNAKVPMPAAP